MECRLRPAQFITFIDIIGIFNEIKTVRSDALSFSGAPARSRYGSSKIGVRIIAGLSLVPEFGIQSSSVILTTLVKEFAILATAGSTTS